MTALIYYKTARTVRSYAVTSLNEMWDKIRIVTRKGYAVTEVNVYENGTATDYTLHFDSENKPFLKSFNFFNKGVYFSNNEEKHIIRKED